MNKKLPTVTVAVSALNEAPNIRSFLEAILRQKEQGYVLEKILVISDGSTDSTAEIAKSIKSKRLEVKDYPNRVGKSTRLNEIFASLKSEYLVLADADVIFAHPHVIQSLIKPFSQSSKIGLIGGYTIPLPAQTFIEKAVNCTLDAYIPVRESYKGGHNVLSATGRLMALKKELAKKIHVPAETISNDGFTYFSCLVNKYEYRHAPKAEVYFRSPQNLKDHLSQCTRFLATHVFMKRYFPADLVDSEYYLPPQLIYPQMLKQFIFHPVLSLYIFSINKYCEIKAHIDEKRINSLWDIVYTTKKLI